MSDPTTLLLQVTISSPDAPKGREVMQLDVYDYFGERALLNDAARSPK